jgi:hypothetical protein
VPERAALAAERTTRRSMILGSKSKAQTDAEKLDDAIKDMEKRLSLLGSGTPNALVDTIVQYTTDKTVGMNDPRLKHLTTGNKAVKDLEEGEDQRREFSKQLLEKQQETKRLREFLKTGVAPEEGFKGQFGKANLTPEQISMRSGVDAETERLKKQVDAKKAADQALYELNRNTYIFNAKESGGLQFSPEQQKAMVLFKKNVDELTEADLKQAHAMLQKERILKANQAAATFMEQRQEALTAAVEKGFEASEKSNDAWDAFTSKSKYAVAALEQLGVVWDELTEKDKKLVATHLEVITKNTEAIAAYKQFASSMERVFNDAFLNLKQGFGGFFKSIVQGFEQMLQEMAAKYLASQLANVLLKGLNGLTGGRGNFADILGSLAGVADLGGGSSGDVSPSIFGLAGGGLVAQDTPYLVGERGPELFTPSRSGRITPNGAVGGSRRRGADHTSP